MFVLETLMGRFLIYIYIAVGLLLNACITTPKGPILLGDALDKNIAVSMPMRVTEKGLIVLEGVIIEGRSLDFILDTGATRSAIFQSSLERLDLTLTSSSEIMVHGMLESKQRRAVEIPKLEIGPIKFLDKTIVILDDRGLTFNRADTYDGLIGMDILSDYQIYISPKSNELRFIPNKFEVFAPSFWEQVPLIGNPFIEDNRALHFIQLRVDGRKTPAMVDTGAEFSAMNWGAASFYQSKRLRRKLREDWELQGAVGTFDPIVKVTLGNVRSGQKFWRKKDFIIMDFKSLDVLGVEEDPFIIVGMNLFRDETVFIDFEKNLMAIKPQNRSLKPEPDIEVIVE